MFGAWQAGAWRALAHCFRPDLVVGASVGALNGWAIAGGISPQELIDFWMRPDIGEFRNLPQIVRDMMQRYPLRTGYAVVVTDSLRIQPAVFSGDAVTWKHLAASCAIPGVLPQYRIEGRWYSDGGLLNPLPVFAAVDLGATEIVAIHPIWPKPALLFRPAVNALVRIFGHYPQVPEGVNLATLGTPPLGTIYDALHWNREHIARWIDLGYAASVEFCKKHFASQMS